MDRSYHGNTRPYALALYASDDATSVLPVLEQLQAENVAVCYGRDAVKKSALKHASVVILFLTEAFGREQALTEAAVRAQAQGVPLLAVDMPGGKCPEALEPLLYATNHIDAGRYPSPEELDKRLSEAEALTSGRPTGAQKRARRGLIATLLSAAAVFTGLAIWLFVSGTVQQFFTPSGPEEPRVVPVKQLWSLSDRELKSFRNIALIGDTLVETKSPYSECIWEIDTYSEGGDFHYEWSTDAYGYAVGERVTPGSITDLSILEKMPNLEYLALFEQPYVESLPPLGKLDKLQHVLLVNCGSFYDLSCFKDCDSMQRIYLFNTLADDLTPLNECTTLDELRVMDTYDPAENHLLTYGDFHSDTLKFLRTVYCAGLEKDAASIPERFPALDSRDLWYDGPGRAAELELLTRLPLTQLFASSYAADKRPYYEAIGQLAGLEWLTLEGNALDHLEFLRSLPELTTLGVYCEVENGDYSPIAGHEKLALMEISPFNGGDLNFLEGCSEKMELYLALAGNAPDWTGLGFVRDYAVLCLKPGDDAPQALPEGFTDALAGVGNIDELYLVNAVWDGTLTLPPSVKHVTFESSSVPSLDMTDIGGIPVTLVDCSETGD